MISVLHDMSEHLSIIYLCWINNIEFHINVHKVIFMLHVIRGISCSQVSSFDWRTSGHDMYICSL